MEDIIANRLITSTFYKIHLIKHQISKILLNNFPSENPRKLAAIILKICELLENSVLSLQHDSYSNPLENIRITKFIANFLEQLAAHLRFVEGASTDRTPSSLILPFESFVNKFYPPSSFLIVRPQWHYNYKIISNLVEAYKSQLEKGLSKKIKEDTFSEKIYIISFPGFEKKNVLLHANLGHEIGHLFAAEFLKQEAEKEKKTPQFFLEIAKKVDVEVENKFKDLTALEKFSKKAEYINQIFFIRERGLKELISDFASVKLFGIAAIFALEEIADTSQSVDEVKETQYYPPLRMRIRFMYETLVEDGLEPIFNDTSGDFEKHVLEALKDRLDTIKNWIIISDDKDNINTNTKLNIAYESINSVLPEVKGFIKTKLSNNVFSMDKVHSVILPLCNRLAHGIPPNAVEEPFNPITGDIPTILNAGWFYKIACSSSLSAYKKQEEYVNDLNTINNLLLKAIELSYIHNEYYRWLKTEK